jgi:hypothetical protein
MVWRNKSCARQSCSYPRRESVNCTLYVSADSGRTSAGRAAGPGGDAGRDCVSEITNAKAGSWEGTCAELTGTGVFRTRVATSGFGFNSATIRSISRRPLCRARLRRAAPFRSVITGFSRLTAVSVSDPSASQSRISGNFLAHRAAAMRLYAALSDRSNTSVQ